VNFIHDHVIPKQPNLVPKIGIDRHEPRIDS